MNNAQIKQVDEHKAEVTGVIHVDNAMALKSQGEAILKSLSNEIEIDLGGVEHSGSVGISVLLAWLRAAKDQDKALVFSNIPSKMFDVARVSGLDEFLPLSGPSNGG